MTPTVSLYRFFNRSNELLYIGITNRIPRRLDEHGDDKPWYLEVARVEVEHHPDRHSALRAEKNAIHAERPRYNIHHNRHAHRTPVREGAGRWVFESRRSGYEKRTNLVLYPELDCSAMVDDVHELDGESQFHAYVHYLERHHPEWLATDAVPIVWTVRSVETGGVCEAAPFAHPVPWGDFLTHFTWPIDATNGEPLDWYALPVVNDRFPEFAKALAWTPSPLQPTCPLASILRSRRGVYAIRRRAA